MAEAFPGSLEQKFNVAGFNYRPGETKVRSSVDVGPAKVRSRFTKSVDPYSASFSLIKSDVDVFRTWYQTTLNNGVKEFEFEDPFNGDTGIFRFVGTPTITPENGGVYFTVSFTWERLP